MQWPFTNIPGMFILGHPCCAFSKRVTQISLSWAPAAKGMTASTRNVHFLSNSIHWNLGEIRKTFKQLRCVWLFSFPSQAAPSNFHWLRRGIHWSSSCWVSEQCSPWHPPSSAFSYSAPLFNGPGDAAGETKIWISFALPCLKQYCKMLKAMQRDSLWKDSSVESLPPPTITRPAGKERSSTTCSQPLHLPFLSWAVWVVVPFPRSCPG